MAEVFPGAEHRYCLRHLHANFSQAGFRGEYLKGLMERAGYAYRQSEFNAAMQELKVNNLSAWEWLSKVPTKHWCRYMFSSRAKTDLLLNNISETYNSKILGARDEPIITMVEHIRTKMMGDFNNKREGAERDNWQIPPNILKKLEAEKSEARYCKSVCAGRGIWQVSAFGNQYVVDLNKHTCGCRKWDLIGIPCLHVVSAIQGFKQRPESYVDDILTKDAYARTYCGMIYPVTDETQWEKTPFPDVDPPVARTQPGRPKTKRTRASDEPRVQGRSVAKTTIRCSVCKEFGHNSRKHGKDNQSSSSQNVSTLLIYHIKTLYFATSHNLLSVSLSVKHK